MSDLISFFVGTVIGWSLCRLWMSLIFKSLLSDLGVKDSQLKNLIQEYDGSSNTSSVVDIEVEMVGTRLYAYRQDNNTFLGYGDSAKELVEELVKKLPTGTRVQCAKEKGGHHLEAVINQLSK